MAPDGEGRDPRKPRLSRASTGTPPLSSAPAGEGAGTPAQPRCLKRKLRGPLRAVAVSPNYRRHVRFCVFPTGGAVLMHLLTVCVGVFCLHKCHIYIHVWLEPMEVRREKDNPGCSLHLKSLRTSPAAKHLSCHVL